MGAHTILVVYESMYGNTHVVADHIAAGLAAVGDVRVLPVHDADAAALERVDLLVVGGPTHVHSLSRPSTRKAAVEETKKDDGDLVLDPDAEGEGLREWFDGMAEASATRAAAFDTRIDASSVLTGRASKGIAKRLRRHGFELVADPESFLVDKHNHLLDGEAERATEWAAGLAARLTASRPA